jgi:hypothetical protein
VLLFIEKRFHQFLAIGAELPQPLFYRFQRRDGKQVFPDFERQTQVVEIPANFPVEPADRLQFRRVEQVLGNAQEILIGIDSDVRG